MSKLYPKQFANKNWNTAAVLDETVEDIKNLDLKYFLLERFSDVDEVADIPPILLPVSTIV